jgi:hypothetical protein
MPPPFSKLPELPKEDHGVSVPKCCPARRSIPADTEDKAASRSTSDGGDNEYLSSEYFLVAAWRQDWWRCRVRTPPQQLRFPHQGLLLQETRFLQRSQHGWDDGNARSRSRPMSDHDWSADRSNWGRPPWGYDGSCLWETEGRTLLHA